MRLTIGRKMALLGVLLYPWFALGGIVGIVAVERTGQYAQAVVDKAHLLHLAEAARIALLEERWQQGHGADARSLAVGVETVRLAVSEVASSLGAHPMPLATGTQLSRLITTINGQLNEALAVVSSAGELAADPSAASLWGADRREALSARLARTDESLQLIVRIVHDEVGRSLSEPYRARAVAIGTIALLTVLIVLM